ncbi:MAG: hypothetical protein ACE5HJ_03790 [Thermoplasmata archaeon]
MGHCPGCGASVWSPQDTYGHILGCGIDYPEDRMKDRRCPWRRKEQHRILEKALQALEEAELRARKQEDREFDKADALGKALKAELDNWSEDRESYMRG